MRVYSRGSRVDKGSVRVEANSMWHFAFSWRRRGRWYPSFGAHRTVHLPLYVRGAFSMDERTEQNQAMNFLSLRMRCWVRIRPPRLTWSWIVTGILRRVGIRKLADFERCTTMLSVRRHQEQVADRHYGQSDRLAQQHRHRASVRSYFSP